MNENIILVTIDCLRNDFYNVDSGKYPFLNYLKKNTTYYSNCHALADNTLSSVPQLLSSTFLNFIPYKEAKAGEINEMCQIKEPRKSIAQTLKENGYNTYGFQTAPHLVHSLGYDKGFDSYDYFSPFLNSSIPIIDMLFKYPFTKGEELNRYVLKKNFREPYFLWIHYSDTHDPYVDTFFPLPLSNFLWHHFTRRPSISQSSKLSWPLVSNKRSELFKRIYQKKVKYMDACLHNLFVKSGKFNLEKMNFILTSDHGQLLGEYNQLGHGYRVIPTPESSNVPLYIKRTGQKKNHTNNTKCTLLDITPTISDLANVPLLESYDGNSLLDESRLESKYLVWSNTLDFQNSKFLLKIVKDNYIFWQDDFNFPSPKLYKFENGQLMLIENLELMDKFVAISSEHISYIKTKQLKYPGKQERNIDMKEELDPEVYKALKALRYVKK